MHLTNGQNFISFGVLLGTISRIHALIAPVSNQFAFITPHPAALKPTLYHKAAESSTSALRSYNPNSEQPTAEAADLQVPKNYAFAYAIRDQKSGDDFSHSQAHNGEATKGEYRVRLPDGRIQIVTYTADNDGYRADIRYDLRGLSPEDQTGLQQVPIATLFEELPKIAKESILSGVNPIHENFSSEKFSKYKPSPNKRISVGPTFTNYHDKAVKPVKEIRFNSAFARPPASYETMEKSEEEFEMPYSRKLLSDVNYLLKKYVKPTIETSGEIGKNVRFIPVHDYPRESNFPQAQKTIDSPSYTTENTFDNVKNSQIRNSAADRPKFIHVHRYHPTKGEMVTSRVVSSKEIFDQSTYISDQNNRPILPTSASYLDLGHFNYSKHNHYTTRPTYSATTDYPSLTSIHRLEAASAARNRSHSAPPNFESPQNSKEISFEVGTKYFENPYTDRSPYTQNNVYPPQDPEPKHTSPISHSAEVSTTESSASYESNDDGPLIPLSDLDARKLSGYFDFVPSNEDSDDHSSYEHTSSSTPPQSSGEQYPTNYAQNNDNNYAGDPSQFDSSSSQPSGNNVKEESTLPHYYYEFSTATPSYRYVDPSAKINLPPELNFNSGEQNAVYNKTFRLSSFLRPLHRERVYIHHNSQPATPSITQPVDNGFHTTTITPFNSFFPTTPRTKSDGVEFTIVRSISSTIPPELISKFDNELLSSNVSPIIVPNPAIPNKQAAPQSYPPQQQNFQNQLRQQKQNNIRNLQLPYQNHNHQYDLKLNKNIIEKIQATLSTRGDVYLKPSSHNKRLAT